MELLLFRVKILLPEQGTVFRQESLSPSQLLQQAVLDQPTAPRYRRQAWHIGNVEMVDDEGMYFALGRTGRATMPVLDQESGDFFEDELDTAPYTHVLLDLPSEVCAIAKKPGLSPKAESLGKNLERVLAASSWMKNAEATVLVSPISDPEQFLEILRSAYAIRSFTVTFTRPNPLDVEKLFYRPMEQLAQEAMADTGSATIKGAALNSEPLEDLTRSAAATGDNAIARVELDGESKAVRRSLRGDTAAIGHEALDTREQRSSALAKLRVKYNRIRGGSS